MKCKHCTDGKIEIYPRVTPGTWGKVQAIKIPCPHCRPVDAIEYVCGRDNWTLDILALQIGCPRKLFDAVLRGARRDLGEPWEGELMRLLPMPSAQRRVCKCLGVVYGRHGYIVRCRRCNRACEC